MSPLLKIMMLLMFWISIMRVRYIWKINKTGESGASVMVRNQEGDWSMLFFVLLVMNKARFDHYKLSYDPLLRYFYPIIVGLFVVYCILQLTQFVSLTKDSLITQEANVDWADIGQYKVKKQLYGYKFTVDYIRKDKPKYLCFTTTRKNKEIIEMRIQEQNVNIV